MSVAFAIKALRQRIVIVLLTLVVVASGSLALGSFWPKTYTSHAGILLGLDIEGSDIDPQSANLYLRDRIATYAELVKADEVIGPIAASARISPDELRERVIVAIVPETVVMDVSVSGATPEEAAELTLAVSSRFRVQVSKLNVETGGPEILPAQLYRPQPATAPDQLYGTMLIGISALAGLVVGVLLALLLAVIEANRAFQTPKTRVDAEAFIANAHLHRADKSAVGKIPLWD
jgi:capsular polysaccharide biosynthesis protein